MNGPSIELHIKEIALHGVPPEHRDRIGVAFERELTRLLVSEGLPGKMARDDELTNLDGGTIRLMPGAGPEDMGAQIAQAVYGGLEE
ncbi:MAG: hypothetical protein H0V86_07460 [Chloroflexia bacterium]|nr:hypothetical protein [Chloroflexia bacterium]